MFSKDLNCRHIKPGAVWEWVNCSSQISSSNSFYTFTFSPMKRLHSTVLVKLQNVEILLKYEKALSGKWEHTVFLSTFKVPHCCLTLYHTIPTFNDPEKEGLEYLGKTRKCWLPAFSPFPTIISTLAISIFQSHLFCRLQMLSIWTNLKICRLVRS